MIIRIEPEKLFYFFFDSKIELIKLCEKVIDEKWFTLSWH